MNYIGETGLLKVFKNNVASYGSKLPQVCLGPKFMSNLKFKTPLTIDTLSFSGKNDISTPVVSFSFAEPAKEVNVSTKESLFHNLKTRLDGPDVPEAVKAGLPQLLEIMFRTIDDFEKNAPHTKENAEAAIGQMYEDFNTPEIAKLNEYMAQKDPSSMEPISFAPELSLQDYMNASGASTFKCSYIDKIKQSYNLYYTRRLLASQTAEIMNHFKNSEGLKPYKKEISTVVDQILSKIRQVGLSDEVKQIVTDAESKLGIKIDMIDNPKFAKFVCDNLALYNKKLGLELPKVIEFSNLDWFAEEIQTLAYFTNNCKQNTSKEFEPYLHNNDLINKKCIFFNPFYIEEVVQNNNYEQFYRKLKHELTHLWHHNNIGDERFYGPANQTFADVLEPEQKEVFLKFKELAIELDKTNQKLFNNLKRMPKDIKDVCNEQKENISDDMRAKLKPVIAQFEAANKLVDEIPIPPTASKYKEYVRTSPLELVAIATEFNHNVESYSPEFKKILERLDAPEMPDTSEMLEGI